MAKSIDIILITYKQSRRDARPQSRCAVKRNACQTTTDHHRSPVGTTELCRAYSALIGLWIILAGIPCLRTSYLSKSVTLTGFRFIWWRLLLDYMTVHYIELTLFYKNHNLYHLCFSSPGIKAVIFHLAIGDSGIQTSYMVFQNVAHGGVVVLIFYRIITYIWNVITECSPFF